MTKTKERFCEVCGASIIHRGKLARFCKPCARRRNVKRSMTKITTEEGKEKQKIYQRKYQKKIAKWRIEIINFFKIKYKCRTTKELYDKIMEGEIE